MIEIVTLAWAASNLCRPPHEHSGVQCIWLAPMGAIMMPLPPYSRICLEEVDPELGAYVAIERRSTGVLVTIPPHVKRCAIPTS